MYSLAEKNRIIQLFKKEENIESIRLKSNVSKSTLYRWKAQYESAKEKSKQVKEYISEGKLEESEVLAKEILELDSSNLQARSQLIMIYIKQGKLNEAEVLAKEILKLNPNDLVAQKQLLEINNNRRKTKRIQEKREKSEVKVVDSMNFSKISDFIKDFRKKVYDGEITIENLSVYNEELTSLPPFEQKMLLAEAYVHWNMAKKATQLLKEATSFENISEKQSKVLKQAIQISKSKSSTPIAKRKQWGILNGNSEER